MNDNTNNNKYSSIILLTVCNIIVFSIIFCIIIADKHYTETEWKLRDKIEQLELSNQKYMIENEVLNDKYNELVAQDKTNVSNAIDDTNNKIRSYIVSNTGYESLEELCTAALDSERKNIFFETQVTDLQLTIEEVIIRLQKYEHYDYALFDTVGKRNDITYEDIIYLEDLVKDEPVNDVDLYLSWIMIESEGYTKCTDEVSTAKGLSQFLDSTSELVYSSLDFTDEWYPNIVYDKEVCLAMMVKYVNDLYKLHNGDLYKTIDSYRGLHDEPYLKLFNRYLAVNKKSIDTIASTLNDRYMAMN